jgi:hypothetical protein
VEQRMNIITALFITTRLVVIACFMFALHCAPDIVGIRGVSKTFGEWYQKTNKTEDTNKLTLLAFKIIASFTTHC